MRLASATVAGLLVLLCGCSDEAGNFLDGSLTESFDLTFDTTRVRLYDSEISVEYVVDSEVGEKVALRVTLAVTAEDFVEGTSYNLALSGTVGRGEGYGSSLPALESGELEFSEYSGVDWSPTKGSFSATFVTPDGSTLTLRGGFSADLVHVEL